MPMGDSGKSKDCCVDRSIENAAKYGGYSHKAYAKISEGFSSDSAGLSYSSG